MDFTKFKKAKVFQRGRGGRDAAHLADEKLYHELLERHTEIERTTTELENGIETITRIPSKDENLIKILQEHAMGMKKRFDGNRAIRSWDPLFIELFDHREQIQMNSTMLDDGIKVTLTADDEKICELIKRHDETLHAFVNYGFKAARHESPYRPIEDN
ncbi:hypothetical protein [Sulfurimonas microaerophilic]|uniref:hypothetical protein n=1 Tax=Sulfurimonas microaerophilic TaxID=3058392 RepID=UPI0027148E52|nr:hypothetical protein [Sulfurimonas sp. hsl 1-7]